MMKSQTSYCSLLPSHVYLNKDKHIRINYASVKFVASGSAQACVSIITTISNSVSPVAGQIIPVYQVCGHEIGPHNTKDTWSLRTPPETYQCQVVDLTEYSYH